MLAYINFPDWIRPEIITGLPFRWYGLMYLIAFAITYYLFKYQLKQEKIKVENDLVSNYFFWGIVGLLLGGRILAATLYDISGKYLRNPLLIFWPFDENFNFVGLAGMSYHGGLIGAVLGFVIYSKVKKIDVLDWGDKLVAAAPLGYTFGRLGNYINAELYGRVSSAPWAVVFPGAQMFSVKEGWVQEIISKAGMNIDPYQLYVNLPRHPSQLYEAFFEGIFLWAVLWFVVKKYKPFDGCVISSYMIGYGIVRFFIEYFREPDAGMDFPLALSSESSPNYLLKSFLNFTTGQILCFLMILGGVGFWLYLKYKNKYTDK